MTYDVLPQINIFKCTGLSLRKFYIPQKKFVSSFATSNLSVKTTDQDVGIIQKPSSYVSEKQQQNNTLHESKNFY